MSRINNPMEIFKLLNGSNCGECGEKTCLAFSVAVFKEKRPIQNCPHLPADVIGRYGGKTDKPNTIDEYKAEVVTTLKEKIRSIDLAEAAERTGAEFDNGQMTIKIFGKSFCMSRDGELSSDIHINAYVAFPVLNHILHASGAKPTGNWITFRELDGGPPRYAHFQQRCEKPLKRVADTYPDLFKDMLEIFDGKKGRGHIDSDVAIVLHPLPLFPIQVCYWEPEEGLESSLHIYFDSTSDKNLDIESIYTMCEGIVMMFEKISHRHGVTPIDPETF
jgi:hypothetical protein